MEEAYCKGTPAQVAQAILDLLRQDHELAVFVNPEFYGMTLEELYRNAARTRFAWPTIPPDAPSIGLTVHRYLYDLPKFDAAHLPDFVDGKREVRFYKYDLDEIGPIALLALPDGTRLLAGERVFIEDGRGGKVRRHIEERMPVDLAPIWARVKTELGRLGLLSKEGPAQAERDEDAPKKPRVPGPGADLDELNALLDWKTMKEKFGPHHNYDAQRLLTILNCLPAAKDGCAAEQDNWMSQGQKHIMNQAPGVDETELSRYLSNARKCGLLEWRGVLLPGRPFTK